MRPKACELPTEGDGAAMSPAYTFRCPKCGHPTHLILSIATYRALPPLKCQCGTEKVVVPSAAALSPSRKTEGK